MTLMRDVVRWKPRQRLFTCVCGALAMRRMSWTNGKLGGGIGPLPGSTCSPTSNTKTTRTRLRSLCNSPKAFELLLRDDIHSQLEVIRLRDCWDVKTVHEQRPCPARWIFDTDAFRCGKRRGPFVTQRPAVGWRDAGRTNDQVDIGGRINTPVMNPGEQEIQPCGSRRHG